MSRRTYIIDGYNAIHRVRKWQQIMEVELARGREALCAYCAEWMTVRNDAEKFIVVFDGDSNASPFSRDSYRGVNIVYTRTGETADSRIISLVEEMKTPQEAIVVSDDGEVMKRCGMAGAEISSVKSFVGKLRSPERRGSGPAFTGNDGDGLTVAERNKITNDLKREWGIE